MKAQWTGDQSWVTLMGIFVLVLTLTGFSYPIEVGIIPFVVGFPTLLLLLILWIGGFYPGIIHWLEDAMGEGQSKEKNPEKPEKSSEFTEWKPVLIVMTWVFLFFIFVFLFGFALISPVFIASFLIRKAEMRWQTSVVSALVATVLIYVFMEGLIKTDLWCGAIPEVIPGILGGSIIPPL
jgi:uncharacterized protein YqhQ